MYESFISLRYLRAKHRQGFISLISLISVAGITVGVIALIIVLSVYAGFTDGLRDQILGINSHIIVQRTGGAISNYERTRERVLAVPGVTAATPYLYAQTLLSGSSGGSGVVLRGIDPTTAVGVISLADQMIAGTIDDLTNGPENRVPGIILGPFIGAVAAELSVGKSAKQAGLSGYGTWIGIIVGTYSSIFVAGPILLRLGVKRDWSKPSQGGGTQFANVDA